MYYLTETTKTNKEAILCKYFGFTNEETANFEKTGIINWRDWTLQVSFADKSWSYTVQKFPDFWGDNVHEWTESLDKDQETFHQAFDELKNLTN